MDPFAGYIGQLVLLEGEIYEVVGHRTVGRELDFVIQQQPGKDRVIPLLDLLGGLIEDAA